MSLVKDFIRAKPVKGEIGLELEVESSKAIPIISSEYWNTKDDPSLGAEYSCEYVSPKALSFNDSLKAIRAICWELGQKKNKVNVSHRTSFHVHVNVQDLTLCQYWTYATAYWLLEDLMFNYLDPYRKGNCFCLRMTDAEGVLQVACQDLRSRPFSNLATQQVRYAACNLEATRLHGSVEFRGGDGKMDQERMETWVTQLYNLKLKSKAYANPSALLDAYFVEDAPKFLSTLLDEDFINKICEGEWRDVLRNSAGALAELAYFHNWEEWEKKQVPVDKNISSLEERGIERAREVQQIRATRINQILNFR